MIKFENYDGGLDPVLSSVENIEPEETKKDVRLEIYSELRTTMKATTATFGLHKKDPKKNSVEVLHEFVMDKVMPVMESCKKRLEPKVLNDDDLLEENDDIENFMTNGVRLRSQSNEMTKNMNQG